MNKLHAIYKKSGKWYLGWVEEVPGVNTQGRTLKETKENLKDAFAMIVEANREISKFTLGKRATFVREVLTV